MVTFGGIMKFHLLVTYDPFTPNARQGYEYADLDLWEIGQIIQSLMLPDQEFCAQIKEWSRKHPEKLPHYFMRAIDMRSDSEGDSHRYRPILINEHIPKSHFPDWAITLNETGGTIRIR
jgi:hypothetical protein